MYLRDDVCYNGVNKLTKLLMSTRMYWDCDDPSDQEYMDSWSENTNFWFKTYEALKNTFIFGVGWHEILYANDDGREVCVGVDVIDSKTMDFLRDAEHNIIYDLTGNPAGYVQKVPYNYDVPADRQVPSNTGDKAQKFEKEEIAFYTIDNFGGSIDGIGLLEPQYDIVRRKKSLEKANTQSALRRGNPRYHAKLGNEKYRAGPD